MPSSPRVGARHAADPPRGTATAWEPAELEPGTILTSSFPLPAFEVDAAPPPVLHAFQISPSAGIPADLLAAETAAARAAGYAAGWSAGLADAREATRARLAAEAAAFEAAAADREAMQRRVFDAIFDAAQTLEHHAAPAAADIEDQIIASAWTIAQALVGQVLADGTARSEAAVKRALALAPANEDVQIAVSIADFAVLSGNADGETDMTPIRRDRGLRTVTIVADPAMADGDAIATCGATTIDARLTAALARVREVLAP